MIVLDRNLRSVSWTAGARAWIDVLPSAPFYTGLGMLPTVVYPAATLARSRSEGVHACALVHAVDGRWVKIEAAPLEGERDGEIAVSLRAATATETFGLLCRAYALSRREREVVALLVVGLDTRAVSGRLFISSHTVQDHLKSVFGKVGRPSRRNRLPRGCATRRFAEPSHLSSEPTMNSSSCSGSDVSRSSGLLLPMLNVSLDALIGNRRPAELKALATFRFQRAGARVRCSARVCGNAP
jgi:hypothetical protein